MYEYVIIGGGIAGLFAAHKLGDCTNKAIFESTYRFGGRIMTERFHDFKLDYGPTRIQIDNHIHLIELLNELHIDVDDTENYKTCFSDLKIEELTLEEKVIYKVHQDKNQDPVFGFLKYALQQILGTQWNFEKNAVFSPERKEEMEMMKKWGKYKDKNLWEYGFWDLLCVVLSPEALKYVKSNSTFYHMIEYNLNALCHVCYMLNILSSTESRLGTIRNGMEFLVNNIQKKINNHTELFPSHELLSFSEDKKGYKLRFKTAMNSNVVVHAKHIIFCCNLNGIKNIQGFPREIKHHFNEIVEVKLFKLFVIIRNPPWKDDDDNIKYYSNENVPCREIHYRYQPDLDIGEILIYGDFPSINFWKYYCKNQEYQIEPEVNNNAALLVQITTVLQRLFPKVESFDIIHYSIKDWSANPFPSGVHFWKPHVNVVEVLKRLQNFNLSNKNKFGGSLHICGETFSFNQGYIESALGSVVEVLDIIKNNKEPVSIPTTSCSDCFGFKT